MSLDNTDDLVGQTLQGRYRIDAQLGEGGMGSVYRAQHLALARTVAVKVLRDELAESIEFRARFEREAMVLSGLSHPNVVTVLDYGFEGELPFLVMEFLEGRDFDDLLDEGRLSVLRAAALSRQLLRAVGHAHSHGLVHRDLKPQNVIVRALADGSEHVTVLDFGLAREVSGGSTVTRTGLLMGTPAYMSPEQATGDKSDARSDVYSLGVMLYEIFAGRHPFTGVSANELLRAHLITTPPPLSDFVSVDPSISAVIERAMAKPPASRFEDANAMLAALDIARIEPGETVAHANAALRAASRELIGTSETRVATPTGGKPAETNSKKPRSRFAMIAIGGAVLLIGTAIAMAVALNDDEASIAPATPLADGTPDPTPEPPPETPPEPSRTIQPSQSIWTEPGDYATYLPRLRQGNSLRDRQHRVLAVQARRNPDDVRPLLLLAHSYVLSRSLTDGMERYESALAIDPAVASEPWTREDLITIAAAESLHRRASALIMAHYDAGFAERLSERATEEQGPWRERLESLAARLRAQAQ